MLIVRRTRKAPTGRSRGSHQVGFGRTRQRQRWCSGTPRGITSFLTLSPQLAPPDNLLGFLGSCVHTTGKVCLLGPMVETHAAPKVQQ